MESERLRAAGSLMEEFAARTGITGAGSSAGRYLWTDAFAVCNFLTLHRLTGETRHLDRALRLVDLVHGTLGRHRPDDPRTGWISGLDEAEGRRHPTRGGLRIGKPLNERGPGEPLDEHREWDRDGQYFHYLTRWMHALDRVTMVTGDPRYNEWALELAAAAHAGFAWTAPDGARRMHWKMSIDLSRPLVPSMGQMDPLDGLVACRRLCATGDGQGRRAGPDLRPAIADLERMCEGARWQTGDELGIGGLLTDAGQLVQLIGAGEPGLLDTLAHVLNDAAASLRLFAAHHRLDEPADARLAFRELGLSIGLRGVEGMASAARSHPGRFRGVAGLDARLDFMVRCAPLAEIIERFWVDPARRATATWDAHRNINSVMLATSLAPQVFLMDGTKQVARDAPAPTPVRDRHRRCSGSRGS